jgi:hypothetical protein
MKLLLLRIKNELYFWLYFYWVRKIRPYENSSRLFNLYHKKWWELGGNKDINSLFSYDEIFVSPCSLNVINCGGIPSGRYLLKIGLLRLQEGKDD